MKKLYLLLAFTVFFALYSPVPESTETEGQVSLSSEVPDTEGEASGTALPQEADIPEPPDTSAESRTSYDSALLCSIQSSDNKAINIFSLDDSVYITSMSRQAMDISKMKKVGLNSESTSKLLVNKDNTLPKNYTPKNLAPISSSKVKLQYSGLKLIPRTLNALYSMVDAARDAGVKGFIINSAYRSLASQQQIFDANLNSYLKTSKTYEEAFAKTRLLVALPGNSEHHTGLAIDIFSINGIHRDNFEGTREQVWMNENLHKYGFIIRYPKDKTKETNSTYEPWHIRYVGIPLSSYMREQNLCLEEFYGKIFAEQFVENNSYLFMKMKIGQKVFIDESLLPSAELEKVNADNILLTVDKTAANH